MATSSQRQSLICSAPHTRSSYDTLFCKPALRWLFQDYLSEGLQSVMRFAPPEDPKVSVNFRFGASLRELGRNSAGEPWLESQKWHHCHDFINVIIIVVASVHATQLLLSSAGSLALRYQLDAIDPLSFIDVKAAARVSTCLHHRKLTINQPTVSGLIRVCIGRLSSRHALFMGQS